MIYNVKISTLTPVHIGSGVKYPIRLEAIVHNGNVGIIKPEKIIEIIGEENLYNWLAVIEKKEDLWSFLQKFSQNLTLEDISQRVVRSDVKGIKYKKDLKEQMHSTGKPIIPGSSIKGAIRTAIITYLIDKDPKAAQRVIQKYRDNSFFRRWRDKELDRMADEIVNSYLIGQPKQDANRDTMRFLQITDALFQPGTIATLMQILNLQRNGWKIKFGQDQLTEAIPSGRSASVRIKINKDLLNKNQGYIKAKTDYFSSLENIFKIIREHTKVLIEYEIGLWEDELKNINPANEVIEQYIDRLNVIYNILESSSDNEAVMRIGGYSTWTFITGAWAKYNENLFTEDEWEHIYKLLNKGRDVDIFPKTRKITPTGDTFGFVKLTIEN